MTNNNIQITRRNVSLEDFLREFSIPVLKASELPKRFQPKDSHGHTQVVLGTYYEDGLQRKSCWKDLNGRRYIESLNKGLAALSSIIVCNVQASLNLALGVGDKISISYFQKILNKGFRYISLDGKNRTITLHRFIENDFTITGAFTNIEGIEERVENKFFKDLSKDLKQKFLKATKVEVLELVGLKSQIFGSFLAIHEGMPLNHIEILNASMSPIAPWVRDIASKYEHDEMLFVHKQDKINRMHDREWVAQTAMTLMKTYRPSSSGQKFPIDPNLTPGALSNWYSLGEGYRSLNDIGIPYVKAELDHVKEVIDEAMNIFKDQTIYVKSKGVSNKMINAVLMVVDEVFRNGNYIANRKQFFEELYKIDSDLATTAASKWAADTKKAIANSQPEPSRGLYYNYWQGVPHMANYRKLRRNALLAEVQNNLNRLTIR